MNNLIQRTAITKIETVYTNEQFKQENSYNQEMNSLNQRAKFIYTREQTAKAKILTA